MTTEAQQLKTALVRELMRMPPHAPVTWQGRRQPAAYVLQALMRGESMDIVDPAATPAAAAANGASSVVPTQDAIDRLSPEQYAELQATGGLKGLTQAHRPTMHVRTDDNSHGVTQVALHWDKETGEIVPGSSGATHEEPAAPPMKQSNTEGVTRVTIRGSSESRNPWSRFDG